MKLQMKPLSQTYKLAFDPDGIATVSIRQATSGDELRLAKLSENQGWRNSDRGGRVLELTWNPRERERLQAFMTLTGADLEFEDDKGNTEPVFKFRNGKNGPELAMTEFEFFKAWDKLPTVLVDEIITHVLDCNPQWDDRASGE
jgi:hypothetical protein